MRQHFRIGLAGKHITFHGKPLLQIHVVFNDTVMDDGKFTTPAEMGMGIGFRRGAMRCPAGMPYSKMIFSTSMVRNHAFNFGGQSRYLSNHPDKLQFGTFDW